MERLETVRRLIVNADDFGLSSSANRAIVRAHCEGILTTASLMVNEPGFDEALALARENPNLGVGLHLTLSHGHSALPAKEIPGLVNECGEFSNDPTATGFRYFMRRELRDPLRREIFAQFEKFRATGLPLDHLNGHLHFHLHPTVFRIVMDAAEKFGVRRMRLTRDPFWLNVRLDSGRWLYRGSHAFIYGCLSRKARGALRRRGIRHTRKVFGLLQNALVDEDYILKLLPRLPAGDSELYSHPSLDDFKHEFAALLSERVKASIRDNRIELIRYQDL
ncbi:MAG TPA: hopanoid biosynthesis-associated protein HpnK [Verrucomicrobiae bacterium]|nr:hopanoid biosynthesis-associated protein HpnK [Verrucomicrobiae bacterium]